MLKIKVHVTVSHKLNLLTRNVHHPTKPEKDIFNFADSDNTSE